MTDTELEAHAETIADTFIDAFAESEVSTEARAEFLGKIVDGLKKNSKNIV